MNRYDSLKAKFANREKVLGTTMQMLADPLLIDKMNRPELDFILLDAEHGRFDAQNAIPMLQTARLIGQPCLMRVQDSAYHLIAKAIDMGADGVMVPRVETLEQLGTIVDAVWFAPVGRKGAGGYAQFRTGENYDAFQNGRCLLCQIESPRGIENLPAMIDEYGAYIDAFIIGPNDLSLMLGAPFDLRNDVVQAAIQHVFDLCNARGKSCGIFANDAADARHYRAMGGNVLWTASDLQFYMRGFEETMGELMNIR